MAENTPLQEAMLTNNIEQGAEVAAKRWPSLVNMFERDSVLAKTRGVYAEDVYALGQMLHQWESYQNFCEANGSLADLGVLPKHALEIITADFGTSIVPHIASVQPIKERLGIIYYKTVKATKARGNVAVGDTFQHPFYPPNHAGVANYPEGYAGEMATKAVAVTAVPDQVKYTGNLNLANTAMIRPRSVEITAVVDGVTMKAIDDGEGNLLGNGFAGTISYQYANPNAAGTWTIAFITAPTADFTLNFKFAADFEESGDVPEINFTIEATDIAAEIFALTQNIGMFKAFEFQSRFGQSAEEMIARELTGALNLEIGNIAISRLVAASVGEVEFNMVPPQFISYAEHMQHLKAVITKASSTILLNAGRGHVNYLIAGATAAGHLSTLPGWEQQIVETPGSNIFGTLDGMVVIRAPHIDTDSVYCVYRGKGGFDTPLVWAPYMPLVVSKTLQDIDNILKNRAVAACWGGLKVVAPTFVTKIKLVNAAYTTPAYTP